MEKNALNEGIAEEYTLLFGLVGTGSWLEQMFEEKIDLQVKKIQFSLMTISVPELSCHKLQIRRQ